MDDFLIIWSCRVKAENENQAAVKAFSAFPSINSESKATKFIIIPDEETKAKFLKLEGIQVDCASFLEWLRKQENGDGS